MICAPAGIRPVRHEPNKVIRCCYVALGLVGGEMRYLHTGHKGLGNDRCLFIFLCMFCFLPWKDEACSIALRCCLCTQMTLAVRVYLCSSGFGVLIMKLDFCSVARCDSVFAPVGISSPNFVCEVLWVSFLMDPTSGLKLWAECMKCLRMAFQVALVFHVVFVCIPMTKYGLKFERNQCVAMWRDVDVGTLAEVHWTYEKCVLVFSTLRFLCAHAHS